jgi:hypothetical protein
VVDFVSPAGVLAGPIRVEGATLRESVDLGNLTEVPSPDARISYPLANQKPAHDVASEDSKRLDQMAEEIKQIRKAIEELTQASKEKR